MNIYDLTSITNVFFCGGTETDNGSVLLNRLEEGMSIGIDVTVHPKEIERQQRIGKRRASRGRTYSAPPSSYKSRGNGKYDKAVIFVSGGFGFGTKDDSFFQEILEKINEICKNNSSHVMFVRGSSDDPSYFTEHKFDFSNVKLLEDYSVVKLNGFDCLCVGGSVPIDRKWRMEQKERIGRPLYFENCNTVMNKELLSEILEKNNVTCVITSDAPTFISPYVDASNDSKWVENDKSIIRDITEQRMIMDAIYGEMMCLNKKPFMWCSYANYDDTSIVNRIKFIGSTSAYTMFNLQETAIEEFGVMLNGEKPLSSSKFNKRVKKLSAEDRVGTRIGLGHPVNPVHVPDPDSDEIPAPRWYEAAHINPIDNVGHIHEDENGRVEEFRRFVNHINVVRRDDGDRIEPVINVDEIRRALGNNDNFNQNDIDEINEFVRRYGGENICSNH